MSMTDRASGGVRLIMHRDTAKNLIKWLILKKLIVAKYQISEKTITIISVCPSNEYDTAENKNILEGSAENYRSGKR